MEDRGRTPKFIKSFEKGTLEKGWYRVIPYKVVAEELRRGQEVLIIGICRRTAYNASRKLSKMIGREVHYSRTYISDEKGVEPIEGYVFWVE
jgi:hypothetical protein